MNEPTSTPLISRSSLLLCGMPLIHYLFTLFFYVCASVSLGEWANTMGMHDPKGFFGGIPVCLAIILMLLSFSVAPLVFYVGYREQRIARHLLIYGISLALCSYLYRAVTPWLGSWIVD